MKQGEDSWHALSLLQRQLKKQFLLVEKQQQEKVKLKREIQQSIRSHYSLCIELFYPQGELLVEEGFDNCYNFIKDVIIAISLNIEIGKHILYRAEDRSALTNLIIYGFYENNETNDPFAKDITRLMHALLADLFRGNYSEKEKGKILQAWDLYMTKINPESYFSEIADETLRQLMKNPWPKRDKSRINIPDNESVKSSTSSLSSWSSREQEGLQRQMAYNLQIKSEDELIQLYLEKVLQESQLCPQTVKIPLRAVLLEGSSKNIGSNKIALRKMWQICSYFYLKPFIIVASNPTLCSASKERILHFVEQLISKWGFTAKLTYQPVSQLDRSCESQGRYATIDKICCSLLTLNTHKYQTYIAHQISRNQLEIQIRIYGAYVNLVQLHELLILIHTHSEFFSKISERLVNRTLKIFQISPKLKLLYRPRPETQFVSLSELRYEQSISSDYYKNYMMVYRSETHKQMIKQVLVELPNLQQFRSTPYQTFGEIFLGIITRNREVKNGNNLSASLEMKIKYLIYLTGRSIDTEAKVILEMNRQLEQRERVNLKLFQDTKFSLLKVYCNVRNLKSQLRGQRESQKRATLKLSLINRMQKCVLDVCLTSKSSRNKTAGYSMQDLDKYRYRISSADEIIMQPMSECIHRENAFTGREGHAGTVIRFMHIFASLSQVRHILYHPSFLNGGQKSIKLYSYCNETKIGQAFFGFIKYFLQKIKAETEEERLMMEAVLFRYLSDLLLGKKDNLLPGVKDKELVDRIEEISRVEKSRDRDHVSPQKQSESPKKRRRGSDHFDSIAWQASGLQKGDTIIYMDQLLQMGSRYIKALNDVSTPMEKIRKLKDIVEIYRIGLGKSDQSIAEHVDQLLFKTLIVAKLPNLISNLSFLEMFLPQQKLMSSEGKILKQFQRLASQLIERQYDKFLYTKMFKLNQGSQGKQQSVILSQL